LGPKRAWGGVRAPVSKKANTKKDGMSLYYFKIPSITLNHGGKQARASSPSSSPSTSLGPKRAWGQ